MKKKYTIFCCLLILLIGLLIVACDEAGGRPKIRWYVGLGAGSNEETLEPQKAVVAKFNENPDRKSHLILEIVTNAQAYDTLATQMAAGNAPDIVGPVGIRGRDSFKGSWLDLDPLVAKAGYDLSDFDPALVDFYRVIEEGLLGLPFAVYPSYIFGNKDLFDNAKLNYPPQKYGDKYIMPDGSAVDWTWDTVKKIGMLLTIDKNGNNATSPNFDGENVVQWGFHFQWTDARGIGTEFGAGSLVDNNWQVQIPPQWVEGWKWHQNGMWVSKFMPNGPQVNSDLLAKGNTFDSNNIAMVHCHLWYAACCVGNVKGQWDNYCVPSYKGVTTAKLHADTFEIMKASKNPEAAFEVMAYLIGPAAPDLLKIYGGMPARKSLQATYFDEFGKGKQFEGKTLNWQVVVDSMQYADNPNHESWMPSFQETTARYNDFYNLIMDKPDTNIDEQVALMKDDLQKIFDAAKAKEGAK
ncbi:MAG: extracellular solute-binding protein [Spirochaetales bacterium]|nr:extracellular solute-binding protein [Spirochaetales bacterium]